VPDGLFYASALAVTAVNRFVLACLSAALPRVVDKDRLVMANSVSPTAGTLAATAGGGLVFAIRLAGPDTNALTVLISAALYLCGGLASLGIGRDLLGPELRRERPDLRAALTDTVWGLLAGLAHLRERRPAMVALTAMTLMRFCYGALTVTVLMLCRYSWSDTGSDGLALLGLAVAVSGAGFFAAAVITPWAVGRIGTFGWLITCAAGAAVLEPGLGLPFQPAPMLAAAFVLGMITQAAKITTDTVVQSSVDDAFRGRVFAIYDVFFNVAFVGAAVVAALILPPDGRSATLLTSVAVLYAGTAAGVSRFRRS
jgi:hypothetical protein